MLMHRVLVFAKVTADISFFYWPWHTPLIGFELALAQWLEGHEAIESVNYPGLKSNPYHTLACKYLQHGFGGVLTFRVKSGFEGAAELVSKLELILHVGSVGDSKSLIVHPASTTHSQLSEPERVAAGVYPNMLRLSVGIENIDDLIYDLDNGLK